jgi:hypothetical protein
LDNHHALEEGHSEELVRLRRATALKFEAHGHHHEAQEWRNYANSLSEAAAVRSEVADKLRAHFETPTATTAKPKTRQPRFASEAAAGSGSS